MNHTSGEQHPGLIVSIFNKSEETNPMMQDNALKSKLKSKQIVGDLGTLGTLKNLTKILSQ